MTPHHRQDNPPRREPDSGSESYEGQDPSGEVAPEYYEEPAVPYDPGAAFMDENQQYGDPGQAYVDPNVAYADPNAVYDESPQSYAAEPQADYPAPPPAISHGGVYDEAPEAPAPPPVKKRIVKKKVVGRAPKPRPLTPRTPPGRGYSRPRPSYSGGGISMMTVLLTLAERNVLFWGISGRSSKQLQLETSQPPQRSPGDDDLPLVGDHVYRGRGESISQREIARNSGRGGR